MKVSVTVAHDVVAIIVLVRIQAFAEPNKYPVSSKVEHWSDKPKTKERYLSGVPSSTAHIAKYVGIKYGR